MRFLLNWFPIATVQCVLCLLVAASSAQAECSSYAEATTDVFDVGELLNLGADYDQLVDMGVSAVPTLAPGLS